VDGFLDFPASPQSLLHCYHPSHVDEEFFAYLNPCRKKKMKNCGRMWWRVYSALFY